MSNPTGEAMRAAGAKEISGQIWWRTANLRYASQPTGAFELQQEWHGPDGAIEWRPIPIDVSYHRLDFGKLD